MTARLNANAHAFRPPPQSNLTSFLFQTVLHNFYILSLHYSQSFIINLVFLPPPITTNTLHHIIFLSHYVSPLSSFFSHGLSHPGGYLVQNSLPMSFGLLYNRHASDTFHIGHNTLPAPDND